MKQATYTAAEARALLYERWRLLTHWHNNHLGDEFLPQPHPADCRVCISQRAAINQVLDCVRMFGGRPGLWRCA